MTGVRWSDHMIQGRCGACHDWWPLTEQFWMPNSGVARCRACIAEGRPSRPFRRRVLTSAQREAHREYNRDWMRRYRRDQRRAA
jgi:hypothetical protein